jgi:DnaJ-class molecular chaperone
MNPYQVLGVPPDANDEVIKAAYRKLSRKYHPDRKGGSAEKMASVNVAYGILRDPAARERWDLTGDERPKTPLDVAARQVIMQMITQIFQQPGESDVQHVVAKSLRDNLSSMRQKLADCPRARGRIQRMRSRMKLKGENNFVDGLVTSTLESLDKVESDTKQGIEQLTRAVELWRETCDPTEAYDAYGRKMNPIAQFMKINQNLT